VIIAAELLKNADELVKARIHPTSVISGYRLACKYVDVDLRLSAMLLVLVLEHWSWSCKQSCT